MGQLSWLWQSTLRNTSWPCEWTQGHLKRWKHHTLCKCFFHRSSTRPLYFFLKRWGDTDPPTGDNSYVTCMSRGLYVMAITDIINTKAPLDTTTGTFALINKTNFTRLCNEPQQITGFLFWGVFFCKCNNAVTFMWSLYANPNGKSFLIMLKNALNRNPWGVLLCIP